MCDFFCNRANCLGKTKWSFSHYKVLNINDINKIEFAIYTNQKPAFSPD
jgi:hypothetical protein